MNTVEAQNMVFNLCVAGIIFFILAISCCISFVIVSNLWDTVLKRLVLYAILALLLTLNVIGIKYSVFPDATNTATNTAIANTVEHTTKPSQNSAGEQK